MGTGFATADFELWPALAKFLIVPLLVLGGMAGSTSGGLKTLRVLLGLRALRTFVLRLSHPLAVRPVRYAGRPVGDEVVIGVVLFFMAYFAIALIAALVMAAGGYPDTYSKGYEITGLSAPESSMVKTFHGGTQIRDGKVVTSGGRVLCVTALGDNVSAARASAYGVVSGIHWQDVFYRTDIGYRAVHREQ